jgi:hypothetical protein
VRTLRAIIFLLFGVLAECATPPSSVVTNDPAKAQETNDTRSLDSPCATNDFVCIAAHAGAAIKSKSGTAAAKQYEQLDNSGSAIGAPDASTTKPQQQLGAGTTGRKFDGQGWTFDVFYCSDRTNTAHDTASKLRDLIAGQHNIGRARLQPWPSGKGPSYDVFHPFEIRVTEQRRKLATALKTLLDQAITDTQQTFAFVEVNTDFPHYISIVVCPGLKVAPQAPSTGQ